MGPTPLIPIALPERMQRYSFAYVRAVASATGLAVIDIQTDDDSIDLQIGCKGSEGYMTRPRIEAQVKCTYEEIIRGHEVVYRIPAKNYNDLRVDNIYLPRILVVVHVPRNVEDWLRHDEQEMAMRYNSYWLSLRGMPDVSNTSKVKVRIPRSNRFDVAGLRAIMERVSRKELP